MSLRLFSSLILLGAAALAPAHVEWTTANGNSPLLVGLYHCDDTVVGTGDVIAAITEQGEHRNIAIGAPASTGLVASSDVTADAPLGPGSLEFTSAQDCNTAFTFHDLDGDLTIEGWFKWDVALVTSSIEFGLRSGAKISLIRDVATPANDRFQLSFTHGDTASAPGFTDWPAVGVEHGALGVWRHVAVTIHSTGMVFNSGLGHDVYLPGSTATFWLDGHEFGVGPVDIAGKQVHDASRIRIRNLAGGVKIDEVAVWRHDWSENGTVAEPFENGRGSSPLSAQDWNLYE